MTGTRPYSLLGIAAALVALAGCIMPDQIAKLEKDVTDVRSRLARMEQEQAESRRQVEEVSARLSQAGDGVTREDFSDLETQVTQVREGLVTAEEQMNDLGRRVDRLVLEIHDRPVGRAPAATPPPSPADPSGVVAPPVEAGAAGALPDPQSLYNTAYADYSRGNYALSISGFEEYRTKFPTSPLADNAMYWIGECHFSQGAFPDAIAAFDRMLVAFPESDKVAAANLKKGLAYLEMNDVRRAIVQLRYVVAEYPQTDEAKVAKDKLTSLGATT